MPNATARCEKSSIGACCDIGVDSAQPFISSTKSAGTFQSCARLSDSWNVPVLVAPSPKNATATRCSLAELEGERGADDRGQAAADDRVRAEVPVLDVVEVHRAAVAVRAALLLAVELGHDRVRVRSLGERVAVRAVRRGDHVVRLERGADARGDRLLADADVQEARQLAGAEALLDLLLEAADQQHLAEELVQPLVRQRALRAWLLLDLGHRGLIMLTSA